jgi:hypothetical protein
MIRTDVQGSTCCLRTSWRSSANIPSLSGRVYILKTRLWKLPDLSGLDSANQQATSSICVILKNQYTRYSIKFDAKNWFRLCPIARSRQENFWLEFHIEWHCAESQINLFFNSTLCHIEFFRIAGSRNQILSAFTEAVKVAVFQKIGHRWSCLSHSSQIKF